MERSFLLQYTWADGTPFLETTTSLLSSLQAHQRFRPHKAATRWEAELGTPVQPNVWSGIWLNFRSASENTFLWQVFFRVIATQRWRFPYLLPNDPQTFCTRCDLGERDDILHCLWSCPNPRICCQWGWNLLQAILDNRHITGGLQGALKPAHILVAASLPEEWKISQKFWHILRAVLCWQIWKAGNEHFMADRRSVHRRTIRKS